MSTPETLPTVYLERMADIIKVLGHPYRLQIIEYLDLNGKSPVHHILAGIGGNQAALSQHLNKMRSAGIIVSERRGKEVWCEIAEPDSLTILNCMRKRLACQQKHFWKAHPWNGMNCSEAIGASRWRKPGGCLPTAPVIWAPAGT